MPLGVADGVLGVPEVRRDAIHAWAAALHPGMTVALSTHINADGDGCGSEAALARLLAEIDRDLGCGSEECRI